MIPRRRTRYLGSLYRSARRQSTTPNEPGPQARFGDVNRHFINKTREAWLYVDSIYPTQIARWDIRHYIGIFRSEFLLAGLQSELERVKLHGFRVLALEPQQKDGGVFVRFAFDTTMEPKQALPSIEDAIRKEVVENGRLPSWNGLRTGSVWLVKGKPWREDMNRFASPILSVAFEGPDVREQDLYELCRPYGRITDLTPAGPVPAGSLRSASVTYRHIRSATIARNVMHGLDVPADGPSKTRLRFAYQQPIQVHAVRDWMARHPKIVLPLLVFLLGTLTYTIFDPIRSFMVEGKIMEWFDYRKYKLYNWLRVNTVDRLSSFTAFNASENSGAWKGSEDARVALKAYLSDMPTTVAFFHGPQGSGKTRMLKSILAGMDRNTLIIDCRELDKANTDSQLVAALASQTGYWPVFSFLNSLNSLVDVASVGLIGQKVGMNSSLQDQLEQILNIVGTALCASAASHRSYVMRRIQREERAEARRVDEERVRQRIRRGTWHDCRLDAIAGNGVMSELGVGDEDLDADIGEWEKEKNEALEPAAEELERKRVVQMGAREDAGGVGSVPIVVIRNFSAKVGSKNREELLGVLAKWTAGLAENQIAHVIVLSDNRENAKYLTKALPSKPLNTIVLTDADAPSSMAFVQQKLRDAGIMVPFSEKETEDVQRLGGRASDLESLIHKVRNGLSVAEAVEDIISRGMGELRKNAFGDDSDDAKSLPWKREQVWVVLKRLAKEHQVTYYDVLLNFPFNGDEMALRSLEHAEIISIGTVDGYPATIRPGKPVLQWVFKRLVNDRTFQASQDIALNEKSIAKCESTIRECEDELGRLRDIAATEPRAWYHWLIGRRSACRKRAVHVAEKMLKAQNKLQALARQNEEMKKGLVRCEEGKRV